MFGKVYILWCSVCIKMLTKTLSQKDEIGLFISNSLVLNIFYETLSQLVVDWSAMFGINRSGKDTKRV